MILTTTSPENTQRLGEALGRLARPGDIFLLSGQLGAGKTCLTQGIAWGLGIEGYATSPSFVVMNQYQGRLPLYHIDLYRLENVAEVADLGLDDYLYGEGVCVVEWAERAPQAFPPEHLQINISYLGESSRRFEFKPGGKRYVELLSQLKKVVK